MVAPKPWSCKVLPAGRTVAYERKLCQGLCERWRLLLKSMQGLRFHGVWDRRVTTVVVCTSR